MKGLICSLLMVFLFSIAAQAQPASAGKQNASDKAEPTADASAAALVTAKATLAAHGGDKLKGIKSLVLKGSVDLTAMGQSFPGAFSTAFSGEKYFFEINSVVQSLKQVYNGQQTYSSIQGFSLPPFTSLGFAVLSKIGDTGYKVTALGESAKKKKGFRVTTPEGFYTDFFVDEKTGRIKGYESSYDVEGKIVTTSVEIEGFQTVDGVTVPTKYSQRFDLNTLTAYANFNTKTVLVNSTIEDSAFALPGK